MDRKMVNFIKEQYPPGTRIRLNSMEDPYAPVAPGTEGEVDFVDDIGTIHMKWDNGRALGIVPGEDSFSVLPPKLTPLKLYSVCVIRNIYVQFCSNLFQDALNSFSLWRVHNDQRCSGTYIVFNLSFG